jgi:hypothetical protein
MEFEVGPVEMQFTVALTREGKTNAGVKVWVIEASASGTITGQRTHQVKNHAASETTGRSARTNWRPS